MKYTCENKLRNFDAWAGGKDVLEALREECGMNLDGTAYFEDED